MIHVSICGAPLQPVAGNWHAVSQEEETGPPGLTLLTLCYCQVSGLELEAKVRRSMVTVGEIYTGQTFLQSNQMSGPVFWRA